MSKTELLSMFSLTGSNGDGGSSSSSSDGGNDFCIKFNHNNSLKDKNGCMVSLSYDFTIKLLGWAHAPRLLETFIQCAPFLDSSDHLLHRIR